MQQFAQGIVAKSAQTIHQMEFQNQTSALERQFQLESAVDKAFNVSHNQQITLRREISFQGTLRDLASNPFLRSWKASGQPLELPANARLIHMSSVVKQTQNTSPVALVCKIKGIEKNSTWTSSSAAGDVHLKGNMRTPIQTSWTIYERQNKEIDMGELAGWNNVTEKSIQAEVLNVMTDPISGHQICQLQYPGITTQLIQRVLPNLTEADISYIQQGDQVSALVPKYIADPAQKMGMALLKSTSFCDAGALEVELARADGKALDCDEGLIDAAPGLNAFAKNSILDANHHASFTLEQTFALYMPS
jgi:hypothetical protein